MVVEREHEVSHLQSIQLGLERGALAGDVICTVVYAIGDRWSGASDERPENDSSEREARNCLPQAVMGYAADHPRDHEQDHRSECVVRRAGADDNADD